MQTQTILRLCQYKRKQINRATSALFHHFSLETNDDCKPFTFLWRFSSSWEELLKILDTLRYPDFHARVRLAPFWPHWMITWSRPSRKSNTFSRGNQWSTREFAPGKNVEMGTFLWSFSLLIGPEWYQDSCINICFSDLKRFGITKKFCWGTNVEKLCLSKGRAVFQNTQWLRCCLFTKF